jgi:hypothetical protein
MHPRRKNKQPEALLICKKLVSAERQVHRLFLDVKEIIHMFEECKPAIESILGKKSERSEFSGVLEEMVMI